MNPSWMNALTPTLLSASIITKAELASFLFFFSCLSRVKWAFKQAVPVCFIYLQQGINLFSSPIFQEASTNLAACQAYRLYNSSRIIFLFFVFLLWHVGNLAECTDNKGRNLCLTKRDSFNLQENMFGLRDGQPLMRLCGNQWAWGCRWFHKVCIWIATACLLWSFILI